MKTGVEKIIQAKGGDAPAPNQTGVQKIIELLGGDPPGPNQTGVDKIVEILENGGGGGNPNSVQVIEGTAENPWGDLNIPDFISAVSTGNASAKMAITSALGNFEQNVYVVSVGADPIRLEGCIVYLDSEIVEGYCAHWDASGKLAGITSFNMEEGSGAITNLTEYASLIPTTLTIIWHPLPT